MTDKKTPSNKIVNKTIHINAPASKVWDSLTNPELMQLWMLDSEINIISDWKVGSQITFKGNLHWIDFENKGTILKFKPEHIFEYSFWSTLSEQPDKPENYSVITFTLTPSGNGTTLTFTQRNFAAETEYQHSNFYWSTALEMIKQLTEK